MSQYHPISLVVFFVTMGCMMWWFDNTFHPPVWAWLVGASPAIIWGTVFLVAYVLDERKLRRKKEVTNMGRKK